MTVEKMYTPADPVGFRDDATGLGDAGLAPSWPADPSAVVTRFGDSGVGTRVAPDQGWQRRLTTLVVAADVAAVLTATWPLLAVNTFHTSTRPASLVLGLVLPLAWLLALALGRAYDPRLLGTGVEEFRRLTVSVVGLVLVLALLSFGLRIDISRGLVVLGLPVALLLDVLARYGVRRWLHGERRAGRGMRRVLLVGPEAWVEDLAGRMRRTPHIGLAPVGCCLPGPWHEERRQQGSLDLYGGYGEIVPAVRDSGATVVALAPSERIEPGTLRRLAWNLEPHDAEIVVATNIIDCVGPRIRIRPVDGLPLLEIAQPEFTGIHRLLKSGADRLFATALLVVTGPMLLAIALAVRLTSRGPALFRQRRVCADGREFWLLKFRTMHVDAERRLASLSTQNECGDGLLFKMRQDPRVTGLGRWLRRFSLDELPQLVNVLLGHMSVVGPRPPLPVEVAQYDSDVRRRLLVRPGLTGLWQVSGRSDLSWEESVRLDLYYVENWSLTLDLVILWKTVPAIICGRGAY
ncbi:MAG: sugar transferase [Marmoricola sp.]